MDLLKSWSTRYAKPGPGVHEPSPKSGFKCFLFVLLNHYAKMLLANLIFILFCIPVITIPASISGLNNVLMKLVRNGYTYVWEDFWEEFKTDFLKRLIVWLPMMTTPAAIGLIIIATGTEQKTGIVTAAVLLVLSFLVQGYLFAMLVTVKLNIKEIIRNAFILTILEWKKTMVILLAIGLIYASFLFLPYSTILLLFFTFVFSQLIICVAANDALSKHIIKNEAVTN